MFQSKLIHRAYFPIAMGLVTCLLAIAATSAQAGQLVNIANGAAVIGGTGDYGNGSASGVPFNNTPADAFATSNVTNGVNASPNNNIGSPITEGSSGDTSFWLGQQNQSTGYFVLDLGSSQNVGGFEIFNTRNGQYDDRGTGNFAIYGSNSITNSPTPGLGSILVSPVLLASGTLTPQTYSGANPGSTPLVPNVFGSLDKSDFQYIEFQALSIGASLDKIVTTAGGVGLNELRIFNSPEPGSLILLGLGVVGVGLTARRRRRA